MTTVRQHNRTINKNERVEDTYRSWTISDGSGRSGAGADDGRTRCSGKS